MARLTTHVLDTARGQPGAGVHVALYALTPERRLMDSQVTNADGRCDAALGGGDLAPGVYELLFHVGAYFRATGVVLSDPPFIDEVPLRFGIAEGPAHYHVPLLVSPWSFSTYRGS